MAKFFATIFIITAATLMSTSIATAPTPARSRKKYMLPPLYCLNCLQDGNVESKPTEVVATDAGAVPVTPNMGIDVNVTLAVSDGELNGAEKLVVWKRSADESEERDDDVYHSPKVFRLNYREMFRRFKVYIYPEGDLNTYYQTPRKLAVKYASEGYFFQIVRESNFVTNDPDQADMFFIPISCFKMLGKGISYKNMTIIVKDYVESLISKYPYWNRTLGADHFFVTLHNVGMRATEGLPYLVKNSIRFICSPSYSDINP